MSQIAWAVYLSSPVGDSSLALGAAQDRRRNSAHPDPARLVDHLPRCERSGNLRAAMDIIFATRPG
jgi:hypothetical protein